LDNVCEAFQSYWKLLKIWHKGELECQPKPPKYRKSGGLNIVSYPKQALSLKDGSIRVPLGKQVKVWFGINYFHRVVNHCLESGIGTVVFGWNRGQKKNLNLGSKTNQQFVQIPTGRLKERIEQLCEQYGIQFVETEESYTSQASFADNDFLPTYGEKPESWKSSGKRIKRGIYRTAKGWLVNADCNGAANILRKVATKLNLKLSGVGKVTLTAPKRLPIWELQRRG